MFLVLHNAKHLSMFVLFSYRFFQLLSLVKISSRGQIEEFRCLAKHVLSLFSRACLNYLCRGEIITGENLFSCFW